MHSLWASYRRVIITGDTPLALIMWGLIILWKKKCCLWVATDLNSSISSKALSGFLSSCSCNSAFVGFLILNRIGPLRHICAGMFSLIFTLTQAVGILMQVWRFILTVLADLFNLHLCANCRHTQETIWARFWPCFVFSVPHSVKRLFVSPDCTSFIHVEKNADCFERHLCLSCDQSWCEAFDEHGK